MRGFAVLTLLTAFAVVVILPNEVGTDGLPAIGSKAVAKVHGKAAKCPATAPACTATVVIPTQACPEVRESAAEFSLRPGGSAQRTVPLLI